VAAALAADTGKRRSEVPAAAVRRRIEDPVGEAPFA
jgi:hypothetical protein